jgi:hypothetical protein
MARIANNTLFMLEVSLTLGVDDFGDAVQVVTFTPTPGATKTWTGLGGNTITRVTREESWTCALSYGQDWETDGSLSRYLHEHAGEEVPATFTPLNGGDPWYATVTLAAGPIGGTGQDFANGSVTLPSTRPSQTAPAA